MESSYQSSSSDKSTDDSETQHLPQNYIVLTDEELQKIAKKLKHGSSKIKLKTKKKLHDVFSGRKLIKWLIRNTEGIATTKEEALMVYDYLIQNSVIANAKYPSLTDFNMHSYYRFESKKSSEEEEEVVEEHESQPYLIPRCNSATHKEKFDRLVEQFTKEMAERYHSYFSGRDATNWIIGYINTSADWKCNKGWNEPEAISVLQYVLDMGYLKRKTKPFTEFTADETKYSITEDPTTYAINLLKQRSHTKSIGKAMSKEGAKPKYPVIILPGLASSSLEVWQSERQPSWVGDRVWIDVAKLAHSAHFLKIKSSQSKKKRSGSVLNQEEDENSSFHSSSSSVAWKKIDKTSTSSNSIDEMSSEVRDELESETSEFLYHLLPANDGISDPKGVKVRASEGFSAIDYLSHSALSKKASYVFAYVIRELRNVGYDCKNMAAAPYDWRIPITKLQQRDGYFTILKSKIEVLYEINDQTKVVPICHSMGNRVFGYFLLWVESKEAGWTNKYIESWMALGAPFLGAPKVIRGVITGDCMGLDLFLLLKEGLKIGRSLGSIPSLLPHFHERLPFPIINLALSNSAYQIVDLATERMRSYISSWLQYQSLDPLTQFQPHVKAAYDWIQQHDDGVYPINQFDYEVITPEKIGGVWELCGDMSSFIKQMIEFIPAQITSIAKTPLFNPHSVQIHIKPCDYDKLNFKVLSNGQSVGLSEIYIFSQSHPCEHMIFGDGEQLSFFVHADSFCSFATFEGIEVATIYKLFRMPANRSSEFHHSLAPYKSEDGVYMNVKFLIKCTDSPVRVFSCTYAKSLKLSCSFFVGGQTEHDKTVQGWWNSFQSHSFFYPNDALATYQSNNRSMASLENFRTRSSDHSLILQKPSEVELVELEKFKEFYQIYEREDCLEYPSDLIAERLQFCPTLFEGMYQLDTSRSDNLKSLVKHVKTRGIFARMVRQFRKLDDNNMVEHIKPHESGFKVVTYCNGLKALSQNMLFHTPYSSMSKVMGFANLMTFLSSDFLKQITVFIYDHGVLVKTRQMTKHLIYARTIYHAKDSNHAYTINRYFVRISALPPSLRSPSDPPVQPVVLHESSKHRSHHSKDDKEKDKEEQCTEIFGNPNAFLTIKAQAPLTWQIFEDNYMNDPFYLKHSLCSGQQEVDLMMLNTTPSLSENDAITQLDNKLPPILDIPKINKIWCIYGVNLDTEISYYFREDKDQTLILDTSADKTYNNRERRVAGGIAYETKNTPQPSVNYKACSGDGTVPYSSLTFPLFWQQLAKEKSLPCPEIDMIEVERADHRQMLSDDVVLYNMIHYICHGKPSPFAKLLGK